jgi:hypothetical protein
LIGSAAGCQDELGNPLFPLEVVEAGLLVADRIFDIVKWCGVADDESPYWKKAVRKMVSGGPCAKP